MYTEDKLLSNTKIVEVLKYATYDNFQFISGGTSVLEAIEILKKQSGKGKRLEALLITKNGKASEKLIGIVTNLDISGIKQRI